VTASASTARESRWLRRAALLGASSLLAPILFACATPSVPDGSPSPSASPAGAGGADCAPINLRAPDGTPIQLTGEWNSDPPWFPGNDDERTFILHVRDCVWISVTDGDFRADPRPGGSYLAQFSGRLTPDRLVTGTLVTVLHREGPVGVYVQQGAVFPIRLEITWDPDGRIHLREVRTQLRCLVQTGTQQPYCPPLTNLSFADDLDESPPSTAPTP
jgi:hypothetical protein